MSHATTKQPGEYGFAADDLPPFDAGPIELGAWFGDNRADLPLELEIGSGKGTFLVQHAPLHPNTNFIGLEYARAYWLHAADRVRRHHLPNVRMVHAEAAFFLRNYVKPATFQAVHIYFPDPWPKKRHHKRRLIQAPFLRELHGHLTPTGEVRLATDHADYFQWMLDHIAEVTDLYEQLPFESPESAGEGELVGTNFERKYRSEGRTFQGAILRKRP